MNVFMSCTNDVQGLQLWVCRVAAHLQCFTHTHTHTHTHRK